MDAPMPGYRHPSLPDIDPDSIKGDHFVYMIPQPVDVEWVSRDVVEPVREQTVVTAMLIRKKCRGPAPYVGRPYWYQWNSFVTDDGTNRSIGGRARIIYVPPDTTDPATWPPHADPADDSIP